MFDVMYFARQLITGNVKETACTAGITQRDMEHLRRFPQTEKSRLMRTALLSAPAKVKCLSGKNEFEKSLLNLRAEGFHLIEVQSLDIALTTVWYRKTDLLLGFLKSEGLVALDRVLDEDGANETTTVRHWWLS